VPHLAALTRTGQGVEPVPVCPPRVLTGLHKRNRRDPAQPLPRRCGLCEGHDPALYLRVADLLTGSVRVLPGTQHVVEDHPGPTKRPGQQRSLARGRISTVTVTSEHTLNVTSHTDNAIAVRRRGSTSSGYPGPEGPGLRRPNTRSTTIAPSHWAATNSPKGTSRMLAPLFDDRHQNDDAHGGYPLVPTDTPHARHAGNHHSEDLTDRITRPHQQQVNWSGMSVTICAFIPLEVLFCN
jgi:hypothetical protein